jgi:hypothetical protein
MQVTHKLWHALIEAGHALYNEAFAQIMRRVLVVYTYGVVLRQVHVYTT